jgi:hypothetical protein
LKFAFILGEMVKISLGFAYTKLQLRESLTLTLNKFKL